jgi:hypothetical protein
VGKPLPHATTAEKSTVTVEEPAVFASMATDVSCFQYKPTVPAGCQPPLNGSTHDVTVETYVGRYSPFYYVFVGLPTLAFVSAKGIWAARLVSGALSAALLALAITSLRRCRGAPLLAAGLGVAITPMALYLAAVVNPSGLEIASAISAWAAAMALASLPPDKVSPSAVGALGASLTVLVMSRALTPLWAAFIAAAFFLIGPLTPARVLLRRRVVKYWLAVCGAAVVASLVWDVAANPFLTRPGAPLPPGTDQAQIVWLALERLDLLVTSSIGRFGWLDTPSPYGVIVAWVGALGAVVLLGVCLARRRGALAIAGNLVAWLAIPTVIAISGARHDGILGQGRDYMALAVGIPIMAAFLVGDRIGDRRATLRVSTTIVVLLAACQVVDFYGALRRNVVGSAGPFNLLTPVAGGWRPPVPPVVLIIAFTLAMVAFAIILCAAATAQVVQTAQPGLSAPGTANIHRPKQQPEPALAPSNQAPRDQSEPVEGRSDQPAPDQAEPALAPSGQAEPHKVEATEAQPDQPPPDQAEPAGAPSGQAEPHKVEATEAQPDQPPPDQAEPAGAQPEQPEPEQPEPAQPQPAPPSSASLATAKDVPQPA